MAQGGVEAQTRQVLANLAAVLEAGGATLADVVKTTIYLVDLEDFQKVNAIYAEHFPGIAPARATVQVSRLPRNALVEIDAIATPTT
jgi:2-iminobutanoate/2-iminopropanoate deaminase